MPTPAVNPHATLAATLLNGDATRKAAKLRFSPEAVKAIDANGDGKIAKDELAGAIAKLDPAARAKVQAAADQAMKDSAGGPARTVLLVGTLAATATFFFSKVNSTIGFVAVGLSLAGQLGGMFWDRSRRQAVEPKLFEAVNAAFK